jgi:hypothetical protein
LGGFLFGTLGLFALAALSLISGVAELVFAPLFWPARFLSARLAGAQGSTGEVVLLTLFNGLLYALLFATIVVLLTRKQS